MLDVLEIPYTGSDYSSLALCLNKARTKEILSYYDIQTPTFQIFTNEDEKLDLKFPLIIKPIAEKRLFVSGE